MRAKGDSANKLLWPRDDIFVNLTKGQAHFVGYFLVYVSKPSKPDHFISFGYLVNAVSRKLRKVSKPLG